MGAYYYERNALDYISLQKEKHRWFVEKVGIKDQ